MLVACEGPQVQLREAVASATPRCARYPLTSTAPLSARKGLCLPRLGRFLTAVGVYFLWALPGVAQQVPRAEEWLTTHDRTQLLAHQASGGVFVAAEAGTTTIRLDEQRSLQTVDGFGFALTGGSAQLLHHMDPAQRHALLQEVFGTGPKDAGVSFLRVSVGASDMNDHVYTYDDMPAGATDPKLAHFSLAEDEKDVIPVLKEILAISPKLGILASPWTAPSWMKTNDLPKGGSLKPEDYPAYAAYLVRYLHGMQAEGVPITALTMQNEPLNPKNTPSMVMEAAEQDAFLRDALGPALRAAGLTTRVVLYDHNCDRPDYPKTILADPKAAAFADGSGFHLYGGEIGAMTQVHQAFPAKNLYFTEQMVVEHTKDGVLEPVANPVSRVLIGAMRNWARTVLLWNLAADPSFGPHTGDGGCPVCQGAITIDGNKVDRNIAFYTVAHASKFVPPGSVRVDSTQTDPDLANVAWRTPQGKHVLLVANTGAGKRSFAVSSSGGSFAAVLEEGSVATFVW